MKASANYIALLSLLSLHQASAHYVWPYTIVNGVVSSRWEYVRPVTSYNPIQEFTTTRDSMCGYGGALPLFPVKTLKVPAGSEFAFGASLYSELKTLKGEPETVKFDPTFSLYHDGPAAAYLSMSTVEDLNEYKGDGTWFKIASIGASDGLKWDYAQKYNPASMINVTIPASTPPGKYLFRVEHWNMVRGGERGGAELFTNCAHIEITGSGTGTPGPVTKFPFYAVDDPRIWLPAVLARPFKPMDELRNWQGPGPAVWKG